MSPLAGRRVVVTRTTEQAGTLVELLRSKGAIPIEVPLIDIVDERDGMTALRLARLEDYQWLVVTSPNGAARLRAHHALLLAERRRQPPFLAAVGSVTAARLGECQLVPAMQNAQGLVDAFPSAPDGSVGRVLVVQARDAEPTLVRGLEAKGWVVDAVAPYRAAPAEVTARQRLDALAADAVLFASGSAVRAWAAVFGPLAPVHAVAIGPTTAAAAAQVGLKITVVATDHSVLGLVASLERSLGSGN